MNGISQSRPLRLVELPLSVKARERLGNWERTDEIWHINPDHVVRLRAAEYHTDSDIYVWRGTLIQMAGENSKLSSNTWLHVDLTVEETIQRLTASPDDLSPMEPTDDRGSRGIRIREPDGT